MLRFFENFDLGETVPKGKKWVFLIFFEILKILKIRDSSFVALLILRHFIWVNWSYPYNCTSGGDSRKPILLVKTGETWRHSDVTHGWPIMTWVLNFLYKVWNCCPERYGKFQSEIHSTSGTICEKPQGALCPPPPPAGRGLSWFPDPEPSPKPGPSQDKPSSD